MLELQPDDLTPRANDGGEKDTLAMGFRGSATKVLISPGLFTLAGCVTERRFWGIIRPGGEALPVGRLAFKAREGR